MPNLIDHLKARKRRATENNAFVELSSASPSEGGSRPKRVWISSRLNHTLLYSDLVLPLSELLLLCNHPIFARFVLSERIMMNSMNSCLANLTPNV